MRYNCILVDERDNVLVAAAALKCGDEAVCRGCSEKVAADIPVYHKLARKNIYAGGDIVKYGQVIGRATRDIHAGEHVHSHNMISLRQIF